MQHHPELERNLIRLLPDNLAGKRILDVGFGKGAWGFMLRTLPGGRQAIIDGIEVHRPDAEYVESLGVYNSVFIQDATSQLQALNNYDYVLCFEVLEHLPKQQSEELLATIERIAKNKFFISTPNGKDIRDSVDKNAHSAHLCGWTSREFKTRGFKVEGLGFIFEPRDHNQKFWYLGHYAMTPLTRFLPSLSKTLFVYKNMS